MRLLLAALLVVAALAAEGACNGQGEPTPSPGPPGSSAEVR